MKRKCETRLCDHPSVEGLLFSSADKESLEFSFGRLPTVIWECTCGWKRYELYRVEPLGPGLYQGGEPLLTLAWRAWDKR